MCGGVCLFIFMVFAGVVGGPPNSINHHRRVGLCRGEKQHDDMLCVPTSLPRSREPLLALLSNIACFRDISDSFLLLHATPPPPPPNIQSSSFISCYFLLTFPTLYIYRHKCARQRRDEEEEPAAVVRQTEPVPDRPTYFNFIPMIVQDCK